MLLLGKIKFIAILIVVMITHVTATDDTELTELDKRSTRNLTRDYFDAPIFMPEANPYVKRADYTIGDHEYLSFRSCQLNTLLKIIDVSHMMSEIAHYNAVGSDVLGAIHRPKLFNEMFQNFYHDYFKPLVNQCYINTYGQNVLVFKWDEGFFFLLALNLLKYDTISPESAQHTALIFEALEQHLTFLHNQRKGRII